MMKSINLIKYAILFVIALVVFSSCDDNIKRSGLPRSIGNTSEVLVVLQNEQQWDNMIGDAIRKDLGEEQYGLSQSEPIFDLAHLTVNNFSDMFKKHRNILIVQINKKAKKIKVEKFKNKWADPQRIIKIMAPSATAFADEFSKYSSSIIADYSEAERSRILSVFRPSSKNDVLSKVRKQFGMNITVPQGFYVAKSKPGFMWIRKETTDFSQGIIIIEEPYRSEEQFTKESIVARTNRDLKLYIPGDSEGTYMKIDEEFIPPLSKQITNFNSTYAIELRGMWNVENDFMGGPYVSYTFLDPSSKKIMTIFAYVYHPNKHKRNLLRQLEAIVYSVSFNTK